MHERALRVLLVEDDLDVAAGLGDYLTLHGIDVDYAVDARQAMHVARSPFDVLVLDLQLPGDDGITLCRRLKHELGVTAPVLFLTAQGALDAKLRAFSAGALDYVVKPFEPAELLARVRALASRATNARAAGIAYGDYRLDVARHLLSRGETHLPLTALTTRLLQQLIDAAPGAVTRTALCDALWDGTPPDSDPLRAHVHQLRRQLQAAFDRPLIVTVRGVGYRFDTDATA